METVEQDATRFKIHKNNTLLFVAWQQCSLFSFPGSSVLLIGVALAGKGKENIVLSTLKN